MESWSRKQPAMSGEGLVSWQLNGRDLYSGIADVVVAVSNLGKSCVCVCVSVYLLPGLSGQARPGVPHATCTSTSDFRCGCPLCCRMSFLPFLFSVGVSHWSERLRHQQRLCKRYYCSSWIHASYFELSTPSKVRNQKSSASYL